MAKEKTKRATKKMPKEAKTTTKRATTKVVGNVRRVIREVPMSAAEHKRWMKKVSKKTTRK